MYGPRFLKESENQQLVAIPGVEDQSENAIKVEDVSNVAFRIVDSMVHYMLDNKKFKRPDDCGLELGAKQVVRIEDLLQIFVDHHDLMTDFLKRILNQFSETNMFRHLERLTQIKLYNRLLECYLVKKQRIDAEVERK